jgi:hypothetical protein
MISATVTWRTFPEVPLGMPRELAMEQAFAMERESAMEGEFFAVARRF